MITIIHGDDVVSSRKFLIEQKNNNNFSFSFGGELVLLSDLVQIAEGGSLFSENKTIFIENLFSAKSISHKEEILSYIRSHEEGADFFLWEEKELPVKTTAFFPKSMVKNFKLPQKLFVFLDGIRSGNGTKLIPLFHELLQVSEPEFIFFMLVRQFRILLGISNSYVGDSIDEVKRLAPWQRSKFEKQKSSFPQDVLVKLYNRLFDMDLSYKTGSAAMSLPASIDFFLSDL